MAAKTASVAARTWAIVVGAAIRSRIRNAISGSARGWMSASSGQRLAVRDHHPRRQPAEDGLVDAQRLALDPARQPQLRTDDLLPGLQAVLDHQRLGFVGRLDAQERAACG